MSTLEVSSEDRGPALLGVNYLFLTMAVAASALRCYTRLFIVRSFGIDDYFMAVATCMFIIYISFSQNGVYHGTGQHHDAIEPWSRIEALRSWMMCELFYAGTMITSKISIGFFFLRVTVHRVHAWIIYGVVTTSIVAGIAFFFVCLFQCNPISDFWNRYVDAAVGSCLNVQIVIGLFYLYTACNIVADFTLAILPVFLIRGLNMDRRTKILLVPLLGMGAIASAGLVVRCPYLPTLADADFLWATLDMAIWSTVEQGLAITAGSLAATRPLIRTLFKKHDNSRPSGGNDGLELPARRVTPNIRKASNPIDSTLDTYKDTYKVSHIVRGSKNDWSSRDSDEHAVMNAEYGVKTNISGGQNRPAVNPKAQEFSESQEELRAHHSGGGDDMPTNKAVVARSFLVTSEQR